MAIKPQCVGENQPRYARLHVPRQGETSLSIQTDGIRRILRGPAPWILLAVGAALFRLTTAPPLWWDEGWTLSVARTWVQTGHYGRLLAGQLIPPGLAAAPTVVLPVALSFRLLGVGAWQGRLPGVLWTALALWLLYRLATELYDHKTAVATLVLALLTPTLAELQPMVLGKQVLGEMPGLCFLTAGYLLFFKGLRREGGIATLGAGLLWSLAALTKIQLVPFLAVSVAAVCAVLCHQRNWRALLQSAAALVLAGALPLAWRMFYARLWPPLGPQWSTAGLLGVTAIVLDLRVRITAMGTAIAGGMAAAVGLTYTARHDLSARHLPRVAVWTFAVSSIAWYLLLAASFLRYLFPAVFLSSIFVAGLLRAVTGGFDPTAVGNMVRALRLSYWRRLTRAQRRTLLLLLPVAWASVLSLVSALRRPDDALFRLAQYLRTAVPPGAVIETYDAEILFVADQPVHFPPDGIHVQLNRRVLLQHRSVAINYDPLAAAPAYLVVGHFSRWWQVYPDDWIAQHFCLEHQFGEYTLYRREDTAAP
jgi:4-amino-4-deoxy-L-arabinose transferase-like glycosyltransferase